jgi:hypothetical protein
MWGVFKKHSKTYFIVLNAMEIEFTNIFKNLW